MSCRSIQIGAISVVSFLVVSFGVVLYSQPPRGAGNFDTPYVGITTSKGIEPGLFAVKSTGVSTEQVRSAADAFLAGLTDEQRSRTLFH